MSRALKAAVWLLSGFVERVSWMASRSHLKLASPLRTALRLSSWSPRSLVAEMAVQNESEASSSSSWKASSSSGMND